MKHTEEQILSILHRTMLRDAQIARARLVYWKSPRTLAFFHLSRNLVHSRKDRLLDRAEHYQDLGSLAP